MHSVASSVRLIEMAPHAEFQQPPIELSWLHGHVDLGLENLGIPSQQQQVLKAAFQGHGVAVPGTGYKLRHVPNSTYGVVEAATGLEPVLPDNWKQGVYTLTGNTFTYIGKRVRRDDQLPPAFEPANDPHYTDVGDGHLRI